jgi:hypothetical protein
LQSVVFVQKVLEEDSDMPVRMRYKELGKDRYVSNLDGGNVRLDCRFLSTAPLPKDDEVGKQGCTWTKRGRRTRRIEVVPRTNAPVACRCREIITTRCSNRRAPVRRPGCLKGYPLRCGSMKAFRRGG